MFIGIGLTVTQIQSEYTEGAALITGTDSDMSGANNWVGGNLGTFDVNTTVAGKLYMLGDGGNDYTNIPSATLSLTTGSRYKATLKARLNAGASTTIKVGSILGSVNEYFEITPTGTEQTFSGFFTASAAAFVIGLVSADGGFNGIAFELDDVELVEIT